MLNAFYLLSVLPIEESMTRRQDAPSASFRALLLVWALYVLVGDGAAVLFAGDAEHGGVQGNILQNLPEKSVSATIVRLLMAIVSSRAYVEIKCAHNFIFSKLVCRRASFRTPWLSCQWPPSWITSTRRTCPLSFGKGHLDREYWWSLRKLNTSLCPSHLEADWCHLATVTLGAVLRIKKMPNSKAKTREIIMF